MGGEPRAGAGAKTGRDAVVLLSLPGIVLVAFLAARLLGARRSLGATLLAGLFGWAAGVGLSRVIASNQVHRSSGFARNVWVFSGVFTVSATVWMELLARPGALARAQTGLASIPRPVRALRWRGRRVGRLGTQGGPPFAGTTSLFQFFGYFGLFCATVLILRVIVAVLHDVLN